MSANCAKPQYPTFSCIILLVLYKIRSVKRTGINKQMASKKNQFAMSNNSTLSVVPILQTFNYLTVDDLNRRILKV